jgi:hypothetical protein
MHFSSRLSLSFINVVIPVGATLTLDGVTVTETCPPAGSVDGIEYCCLRVIVEGGAHRISSDRGFSLMVSGFHFGVSYVYTGGARLARAFSR